MLKIHVLNVGHGDSIVLEYKKNNIDYYGVIDSNRNKDGSIPALEKLKELGAVNISFIALTHPDADHYSGMFDLLEHFGKNISTFYTFPTGTFFDGRLKKLAAIYKQVLENTDSVTVIKRLKEFVQIIHAVKKYIGPNNWEQPNGFYNIITPIGFDGVKIAIIQPPASVKGRIFNLIETGSNDALKPEETNALSLAFQIEYKGNRIVLCGDSTKKNWLERERVHVKRGGEKLNASISKLPHHGSKYDCTMKVLEHIFSDGDNKAIISANGQSHPADSTLTNLKQKKINPYCTCLSRHCFDTVKELVNLKNIDPVLARFVRMMATENIRAIQACQGNISIIIDGSGEATIERQYKNACDFRGDFDLLKIT